MPVIKLETLINAPIERVFDLARSIDLHAESLSQTNEKAVAGVTEGLINLGETVTWEAVHFGLRQRLTSQITAYERPFKFTDKMISGAFAGFEHEHFFQENNGQTVMRDVFAYDSPLGFIGRLADFLFLQKYLKNLLIARNRLVKEIAESEDWRRFI